MTKFVLIGFVDSDWVGSIDYQKSTSSYIFTLGSGVISWSSKKQDVVALSSSQAEYIAATILAYQAVWPRRLLPDLGQVQEDVTSIYCDNIRYHFIRHLVADEVIELKHCGTSYQVADVLTKSLAYGKLKKFRMLMRVTTFVARGIVS